METRGSTRLSSSQLMDLFNEEEVAVSEILLQLPTLITVGHAPLPLEKEVAAFAPSWGIKRKRSCEQDRVDRPSPIALRAALASSLVYEFMLPSLLEAVEEKFRRRSPDSPLFFKRVESEDKAKGSKRRKTKEEWLKIIDDLKNEAKVLSAVIQCMDGHNDILEVLNLDLGEKLLPHQSEIGKSSSVGVESAQPAIPFSTLSSLREIGSENGIGSSGVSVQKHFHEKIRPSRALAAKARRKRIQILVSKRKNSAMKPGSRLSERK